MCRPLQVKAIRMTQQRHTTPSEEAILAVFSMYHRTKRSIAMEYMFWMSIESHILLSGGVRKPHGGVVNETFGALHNAD